MEHYNGTLMGHAKSCHHVNGLISAIFFQTRCPTQIHMLCPEAVPPKHVYLCTVVVGSCNYYHHTNLKLQQACLKFCGFGRPHGTGQCSYSVHLYPLSHSFWWIHILALLNSVSQTTQRYPMFSHNWISPEICFVI